LYLFISVWFAPRSRHFAFALLPSPITKIFGIESMP